MADENLEGTNINERLLVLNLLAYFDRAATARDRDALIEVLLRAKVARAQAEQTAEAVLADPGRYGF